MLIGSPVSPHRHRGHSFGSDAVAWSLDARLSPLLHRGLRHHPHRRQQPGQVWRAFPHGLGTLYLSPPGAGLALVSGSPPSSPNRDLLSSSAAQKQLGAAL